MNKWRQGQMSIEAATLMILVVSGILLAGPTVIKGINAYFKSGEESVKESIRENIVPAGLVEGEFETCECSEPLPLGCGDGGCLATEMHGRRVCNPGNCHFEWCATLGMYCDFDWCITDPACCLPWVSTGLCGINADPLLGLGGSTFGGCPDGFMEQRADCGGGPNFQCVADVACEFHCQDVLLDDITNIADYRANWCPGGVDSGLNGDTPALFEPNINHCTGAKCQAYCWPTYTEGTAGCSCQPPTQTVEMNNQCYCDYLNGWLDDTGCGDGACESWSCGASQCYSEKW